MNGSTAVRVVVAVVIVLLLGGGSVRGDDVHVAANWPKHNTGPLSSPINNKNMSLGVNGRIFVTGQTETVPNNTVELAVWHYEADGTLIFSETWSPTPYAKYPTGIAVAADQFGGAYVVGTYATPMQGTDIVILYYNADGTGGVIGTFNGLGNGDDYAVDVTVDAFGNGWVGGVTQGASSGSDYLILGYSAAGILANSSVKFDHASLSDILVDIDTFSFSASSTAAAVTRVTVTGTSYEAPAIGTQEDIQTLQYVYTFSGSPTMTLGFTQRHASGSSDKATSVATYRPNDVISYPHGNIFVSGYTTATSNTKPHILILGYPEEGTPYWGDIFANPDEANQQATSAKLVVGIPPEGSPAEPRVFIAGTVSSSTGSRVIVRSYERRYLISPPNPVWTYLSSSDVGQGEDQAADIAMNSGGAVYVTSTHTVSGNSNYRTIKLRSKDVLDPFENRFVWDILLDGGYDVAGCVRVNPVDSNLADVYVTGRSSWATLPTTYTSVRYFQTP